MEDVVQPQPESSPDGGEKAVADATAAVEGAQAVEALAAERDRLQAEKDELWDRLLRKQAEFENFRRRSQKEKEELADLIVLETLRALLPVLDDFERALKAPATGEEYRKGIELIYKRLYDTLVQKGLTPIETQNRQFDPNYHQAVDTVRVEEGEDHYIVEEYQRGYEFKGRLVRPAMVKVAIRE